MVDEACGDEQDAQPLLNNDTPEAWTQLANLCIRKHRDAIKLAGETKNEVFVQFAKRLCVMCAGRSCWP